MNITHFIQFAKYAAEEAAKDSAKSTPQKSIQGRFADVVKNDPSQAYAFYRQNADALDEWANGGMPTNVAGALAAYRNNPYHSDTGDRGGPFSTPVNTAIQQRLLDANDNYERLMSLARFYNAQNNAGANPQSTYERAAAISKLLNKPETPLPQGVDADYFKANLFDRLLNSPNRTLRNSLF